VCCTTCEKRASAHCQKKKRAIKVGADCNERAPRQPQTNLPWKTRAIATPAPVPRLSSAAGRATRRPKLVERAVTSALRPCREAGGCCSAPLASRGLSRNPPAARLMAHAMAMGLLAHWWPLELPLTPGRDRARRAHACAHAYSNSSSPPLQARLARKRGPGRRSPPKGGPANCARPAASPWSAPDRPAFTPPASAPVPSC